MRLLDMQEEDVGVMAWMGILARYLPDNKLLKNSIQQLLLVDGAGDVFTIPDLMEDASANARISDALHVTNSHELLYTMVSE